MTSSSHSDGEIRHLFSKHVPEVAAGTVELVAIAREPGKRVMVAVRSHDSAVHAVGACVGMRGIYPKAISRELGGEKINIVLWSESPAEVICHALGGLGPAAVQTPKVRLDPAAHRAEVMVSRETRDWLLSADEGLHVRLASKMVGWDIQLLLHEND